MRLDKAMAEAVENAAVAIAICRGRPQRKIGCGPNPTGVLDASSEILANPESLYAVASNTKAFTSAALAQLVDAGALSWNDRVQDYLPNFELYDPYVTSELRIADLLCHRSGLATFSGDLLWYGTFVDIR